MLPVCQPLPVIAKRNPFDGAEWIFELKYDGFRALAFIEHGRCRLVSRNGHEFSSFGSLASSLANLRHESGLVLDGEIACVDAKGRPRFNDLLFSHSGSCSIPAGVQRRSTSTMSRRKEQHFTAGSANLGTGIQPVLALSFRQRDGKTYVENARGIA
jgi:hypothetical protein